MVGRSASRRGWLCGKGSISPRAENQEKVVFRNEVLSIQNVLFLYIFFGRKPNFFLWIVLLILCNSLIG